MATLDAYIVKYYHGEKLVREREVTYVNQAVNEFVVDPDKLCCWYLLEDVKKIAYYIEKDVILLYKDSEGIIKSVCGDQSMVGLAHHLSTHGIIDIYVETSEVIHGKNLQRILLSAIDGDVENGMYNVNDIKSDSNSSKDYAERLAEVPFIQYNLDEDEETNEARDKVRKCA